jgi:hypothetical protein
VNVFERYVVDTDEVFDPAALAALAPEIRQFRELPGVSTVVR